MLERAKEVSKRENGYDHIEYVRWADDLIILIDGYKKWKWLEQAVSKRLRQELLKIRVEINEDKTRIVDLKQRGVFNFLGFTFRRIRTKQGKWGIRKTPKLEARTKLLRKLKLIYRNYLSQPIDRVIYLINPILRGWINYFRIGNSSRCFGYIKDWVEKKTRRHLMKSRKRKGFGWERWSRKWLYDNLGLYNDYQIRYYSPLKANSAQ